MKEIIKDMTEYNYKMNRDYIRNKNKKDYIRNNSMFIQINFLKADDDSDGRDEPFIIDYANRKTLDKLIDNPQIIFNLFENSYLDSMIFRRGDGVAYNEFYSYDYETNKFTGRE